MVRYGVHLGRARNGQLTAVKSGQDPWLLGMEVDALDPLAAGVELSLRGMSVNC